MLEATVIILDNTEFMRNGDYNPTRLEAQNDAVHLLSSSKLMSNVENAVSIMTMGGSSPNVMVTLTSDQGKLGHAISSVTCEGSSANFKSALQVAQLVLKHRQNPNQHQRIVAFVGSPLSMSKEECLTLHKGLRKNDIAIDVISFGDVTANEELLEAIVHGDAESKEGTVEEEDACRLLRIFQGQGSVVEAVSASPIVRGENGQGSGNGASGAGFEFGVDPEMDPELALALKLSMEDELARQAREDGKKVQEQTQNVEDKDNSDGMDVDIDEEEAMLQEAIAMSMQPKPPQQ